MKVRGSTLIIIAMFVTWISYIVASVYVRMLVGDWLPTEITVASAGLFITELACLAKIRLAKEGAKVPEQANSQMDEIGAGESAFSDVLEEAIEETNGKHARSEEL